MNDQSFHDVFSYVVLIKVNNYWLV